MGMAAKSCVKWSGSTLPPLVRGGLHPPPSSLVGDGVQRPCRPPHSMAPWVPRMARMGLNPSSTETSQILDTPCPDLGSGLHRQTQTP